MVVFCHTFTWISHGCTCVPHPDPTSFLPPHPIPQGHPSAPVLSTLPHASTLNWRSDSHFLPFCLALCFSPLTGNCWLYFECLPLLITGERWNMFKNCQPLPWKTILKLPHTHNDLFWVPVKIIFSSTHSSISASSCVPTSPTYCLVVPQLFWSESSCLIKFSSNSHRAWQGVGTVTFNIYWLT